MGLKMSKVILNYWMQRLWDNPEKWEFMGFAQIDPEEAVGIFANNDRVVPLYVFRPEKGWGDSQQTSTKLPWVLYADGGDDSNYYMLFGTKKEAVKCAKEYVDTDAIIDFQTGEYKGRKWQWDN